MQRGTVHADILDAPMVCASVLPFGPHRKISPFDVFGDLGDRKPIGIFNQVIVLTSAKACFNSRAVSGDRVNPLSILAILWAVLLAVSQPIDTIKLLGILINGLIQTEVDE